MTKAALNPQNFVDAALEVIDEVGVDKLTMRRVALALGVSPMALYKHFANKDELLAAALEEMIVRADVLPTQDLPWQDWVRHVANGMYTALCAETSWVPLLGSLRLGGQANAVIDAFVNKLCAAGFNTEQALEALFAMLQLVIGAVCLHASLRPLSAGAQGDEALTALTHAYLQNADRRRLEAASDLDRVVRRDQLTLGLPFLISALEAQLPRG
ncbi:TetR family transcriptional regulator [Litorivivens sp.]|uniref:TetR family transcriptional regulator n=2 Tax=Litorivivens sp. TaxID=2020868 RepID=UPI00356786AD